MEHKRVSHLEQIPPLILGKDSNQRQKTGGGDGAANRTTWY
ncbi:hypothetical protein [Nostoc commune]|nr:hypothetical protein [Nostoc commune]